MSPRLIHSLIVSLLLCWLPVTVASAGLLDQAEENPFLPVDQAFILEDPAVENDALIVKWLIADEYYLYRHRLGFRLGESTGLQLGEAVLPTGEKKHDEYFGEVEVYHGELIARLPLITRGAVPTSVTLEVDYQGCAEQGLCYPPQTRTLDFDLRDLNAGVAQTGSRLPAALSESDRLATVISSESWWTFCLQFLGLGLLLAFTPCILPMVPILSGIVVGLDQERKALKGFLLSLSYVIAMAAAYAFLGAAAGVFGHNLQAVMQAPLFIGFFSAVFVVLALAMFGVYKLQLPSGWQSRVHEWSSRHQGGTFFGAAAMGFFAALIVGPCLAPPLAGALLYIGQSGDPLRGAAALFSMGLGMGIPLIILGTLEGRLLPKTGAWMERVNHVFGVILLGVAIWLLSRVIPAQWTMILWAALVIGCGLHLGALNRDGQGGWAHARQALGLISVLYGVMIFIGGMLGGDDPLQPVPAQGFALSAQPTHEAVAFQRIKTRAELDTALQAAQAQGRPVMLDFYADWCVSCKHMEAKVFPAAEVRSRLQNITLLQADVTANDELDRELMQSLEVIGPPTILFYNPGGEEQRHLRLVGELDAPAFAAHLDQLLAP